MNGNQPNPSSELDARPRSCTTRAYEEGYALAIREIGRHLGPYVIEMRRTALIRVEVEDPSAVLAIPDVAIVCSDAAGLNGEMYFTVTALAGLSGMNAAVPVGVPNTMVLRKSGFGRVFPYIDRDRSMVELSDGVKLPPIEYGAMVSIKI